MKHKIESIQALRGFAALFVCCFHMRGLLNSRIEWGNLLFDQASVGVLMFFVISGVIIVVTTQNADTSYKGIAKFLAKRILRIIPLYYVLTIVLLIVIGKLSSFIVYHPDLMLKSFLFMPTGLNSVGGAYGMPVLKVGWTLNYEIFFYLLVALSLLFSKWRWSIVIIAIPMLVWVIPFFSDGHILLSPSGKYSFTASYLQMATNPLMLCFLIGVIIGLFYCSGRDLPSPHIINAGIIGSTAIFLFCIYGSLESNLRYHATILSIGLLILFLMMKEKQSPIHINPHIVKLGDISFSIYMVHTIIIVLLSDTLHRIGIPSAGIFFINIIVILLSAFVLYILVEDKMTSWVLKKLQLK